MAGPIWQKGEVEIDAALMAFMAGEDVLLDRELFEYDLSASAAHARGLCRIGMLDEIGCADLCREIEALRDAFRSGEFVLDARFEDGHSAIEFWLTERLGDLGRRIHTGRSRNDQVLVAQRLWLRDALDQTAARCRAIATLALARAREDIDLPMPGYTHLQRAMVSSTAMWWAALAECFVDNTATLVAARALINANPLGTASGYGINLPLDRDGVAEELGFERLLVSPIAAQLSRGKYEWQALSALAQCLLDVRRFAWDLSLFCSAEFDFARLPERFTTGSSLMPNKRNPDVVELLRAAPAPVFAALTEIQSLLGLPLGYHRDLQMSKGPLIRAFQHGRRALAVAESLFTALDWNPDAMHEAIDGGMYATDYAIELARAGVPFREAYQRAAQESAEYGASASPARSLVERVSPGGAARLELERIEERLLALTPADAAHGEK